MGAINTIISLKLLFQLILSIQVVLILSETACTCTTLYPKRYLQDADTLSPSISLSTNKNYNGKELFFDGTKLSLAQPRIFKSHRFTGKINWTLYPNLNFSGQPTCLVADQSFPVTYNNEFDVMVGSIRRGCWCNYSITVTPKQRGELRTGAVTLWSKRNAKGISVLTDGKETRLPEPFIMNSFELRGPWKEWTAFSLFDLTGNPTCLAASRKSGDDRLLYTNTPNVFAVGSIQQSCIAESAKFEMNGEDYVDSGSNNNNWKNSINLANSIMILALLVSQYYFM